MNLSKFLLPAFLILTLFSCEEKSQGPDPRLQQPEQFKILLEAHGDWVQWVDAKSLSFAMVHETTLEWENHYLDLQECKVRIDADLFQA